MNKALKILSISTILIGTSFMLKRPFEASSVKYSSIDLTTTSPTPTPIPIEKIRHPRMGLLNIGHAVFGLTSDSFNCDAFFEYMKGVPEWHISFMYNSFGNNFSCLKRLLDDPRLRTVQVHLINEVSQRNGTGQWFEFTNGYFVKEYNDLWEKNDSKLISKFSKYVKPLQQLFEQYLPTRPHVQCIIGPGLESNVYEEAARNQVEAARNEFPYCRISWNGMKSTAWNADLIEDHSANNPGARPPCLINLDGEDIDFPERRSPALSDDSEWTGAVSLNSLRKYVSIYANRCELYYLWTWESNCSTDGAHRDPNQRNRDCNDPQVLKVMKLMSNEIKYMNKNLDVKPEVYNWSYDESLPLKLCSSVKKKEKVILADTNSKGKVKLPIAYNIQSAYVMYKDKVIDVYYKKEDKGSSQIWTSTVNPIKRYPYKTVLVTTVVGEDQITKTVCWKINSPLGK